MGLFKHMKTGMDLSLQAMAQGGATPTVGDRDAVQAQGNEYRRLMQVGLPGRAVIAATADTGARAAGNTIAALALTVTPDGGEPYDVDLRYIVAGSDLEPYAPGSSYPVRIDPENRANVTFG